MDELTVRDGFRVPPGLPDGEFITWPTGTGDQFTIACADPRILISAELLAEIFVKPVAGVSLSLPPDNENGTPFWTGAVLKISGVNRTVIYRITDYVARVRGYIGEWPD